MADGSSTGRVTGLGGIFVLSANSEGLSAWYRDVLGLTVEAWGGSRFDDAARPSGSSSLWCSFNAESGYLAPSPRDFMINFIVDDMDLMLSRLDQKGVAILGRDDSDDNGRFAWVLDPDGTKIELWQPGKA
ncbi:VOC family protein [Martelella sp. HB161492]|uniref:VOC family protein n=1 Tax=Martelella sp. HB161492 TaxID=2720726 RepID=UPI0015904A91|nr:VOC family protein [Martelella sp. HB161492]